MPKEDLRNDLIGTDWEMAHIVKYGSIPDGIFRSYCGAIIEDDLCVGDSDDYDCVCDECWSIKYGSEDETEQDNPDDRRKEDPEWPRNTDLDRMKRD